MMHGHEKSGDAIVAEKPTNKAERSAAEPVEPRAKAKGNAGQQSTHRAQYRVRVAQALAWPLTARAQQPAMHSVIVAYRPETIQSPRPGQARHRRRSTARRELTHGSPEGSVPGSARMQPVRTRKRLERWPR